MLTPLLLLLSLPLSRALVTRHGARPALTPVLRLKGGAGFNDWIRLLRVVVKGAKLCGNQGRYGRPARPKRLIGRGWPKLGVA